VSLYVKVLIRLFSHDRSTCPYAHNFNDYRRDPIRFKYEVSFMFIEDWRMSSLD